MAPKASACNWNNRGREDLECEIVITAMLLGKSRLDPEYGASFVSTKGACGRGPNSGGPFGSMSVYGTKRTRSRISRRSGVEDGPEVGSAVSNDEIGPT
jgi:hypothetical protein